MTEQMIVYFNADKYIELFYQLIKKHFIEFYIMEAIPGSQEIHYVIYDKNGFEYYQFKTYECARYFYDLLLKTNNEILDKYFGNDNVRMEIKKEDIERIIVGI